MIMIFDNQKNYTDENDDDGDDDDDDDDGGDDDDDDDDSAAYCFLGSLNIQLIRIGLDKNLSPIRFQTII